MPFSNASGFLLVLLVLGTTTGVVSPVFAGSKAVALMNNRHAAVSSSTPLSPEHVFYANSQVNFSWDDPGLRRRLWSRQPEMAQAEGLLMPTPTIATEKRGLLQKRAPPRVLGTIVKIPSCLGCTLKKHGLLKGTIDELTVDFLERFLIPKDPALLNTCLFYTSVAEDAFDKDAVQHIGSWYNGPKPPKGLSKPATTYGCDNGLVTIWNAFPGSNDVTNAGPDSKKYNFWEVMVEGTWLYEGLYDPSKPPDLGSQVNIRTYFENLSKAFANHCGGTIRILTLDPKELKKYGYIWGNHELKVLRGNLNSVSGPKPTVLIAIDAVDPTIQYMIDWGTDLTATLITKNNPLYFDPALLQRRDTCDQNVHYEPDGQDWFG